MTLRPSKHSHPDRTIVYVAMLILARLKARRLEDFDKLQTYVAKAVKGGAFLFLPALDFLFLLGLIEYRPKADAFEYVGPNETL